jgi:hypothetical protein
MKLTIEGQIPLLCMAFSYINVARLDLELEIFGQDLPAWQISPA